MSLNYHPEHSQCSVKTIGDQIAPCNSSSAVEKGEAVFPSLGS